MKGIALVVDEPVNLEIHCLSWRNTNLKKRAAFLAILILSTSALVTGQTRLPRKSDHELVNYVRAVRVQIMVSDPFGGAVTGAGVWISQAIVATCWRNLSENPDAVITIKIGAGKGKTLEGKLVNQDIQKNIAIIQVNPNRSTKDLKLATTVPIPAAVLPRVGDKIIVPGSRPVKNSSPSLVVQHAPVSAVRPVKELGDQVKILVSNVKAYGYSGEPVLDRSGRLLGILEGPFPSVDRERWGTTEVVIPIKTVLELVERLEKKTVASPR